ncbi:hypothetical protein [Fluviicola sp.]|uniref:hypothetical protein n=1 Tax=Fluviicola sp. TaxID=1917219 RepID=UPI0031D6AEBF
MNKKNYNWGLYIVILIVVAIIFWHFSKRSRNQDHSDKEAERLRRITDLENEKQLLIDDRNKAIDLEKQIKAQSEKLWRKLIRILIILLLFSNALCFLIMRSIDIENVLTFNSIVFGIINLAYLFCTFKLFSVKQFLFEHLKEFSYKIVAGNKDASYFATKLETVQNRIDQIDLELNQLRAVIS